MNQLFFKFYLFILTAIYSSMFAQDKKQSDFSSGILKINERPISVKVFASTDFVRFNQFSYENENSLVIVTDTNFEAGDKNRNDYNESVLNGYIQNGFQPLNENFEPKIQDIQSIKYLVKVPHKISETDKTTLETEYKIWNPSKGIQLGSFTLHFYSLMFVFAFGFGYLIMQKIFRIDNVDEKYLEPLFTLTLIGTILGARLGHVIFYEPELFRQDFWSVFLPIRTQPEFEFTGFSGLASHGATIALILTTLYYSFKIIKKNPLWVYDRIAIVVALGGGFVRIGNFFNSEIIGKVVAPSSPFAILFPQMSSEYGLTVPRYPSQLFEAVGYFLLFLILWILYRYTQRKHQQGWLFGLFFIILWSIRFFVEYLKEPQGNEFIVFDGLNTGQILSIPFIFIGIIILFASSKFKTKSV